MLFKVVHPPMILRCTSVPKSVQSRCKVGAKSVREGRIIEFGSEDEGRKKQGTSYAKQKCFVYSVYFVFE